jgi:hypothetical protein
VKAKALGVLVGWWAAAVVAFGQAQAPPTERPARQAPAPSTDTPPGGESPAPVVGTIQAPPACLLPGDAFFDNSFPVFLRFDGLMWWLKPGPVSVPLVAATRARQDLARASPGLTNPNLAVVFGNQDVDFPPFYGFRIRAGVQPAACGESGIELGGFLLPHRGNAFLFQTGPGGNPGLVVPFRSTATTPPTESGLVIGGLVGGRVVPGEVLVTATSKLWGVEVGPPLRLVQEDDRLLDVLFAFRHLGLVETLILRARSFNGAETFETFDAFQTKNYFFGFQPGVRAVREWGDLSAEVTGKIAFGAAAENIYVSGSTVRPASAIRARPGAQVVAGGLFSFPTQGAFRNARFAVVPELELSGCWRITDGVYLRAGYSFLYWSSVMRPGDQIIRALNPRQLPVAGGDFNNPPAGVPAKKESDFWAQGFHLGVEVDF